MSLLLYDVVCIIEVRYRCVVNRIFVEVWFGVVDPVDLCEARMISLPQQMNLIPHHRLQEVLTGFFQVDSQQRHPECLHCVFSLAFLMDQLSNFWELALPQYIFIWCSEVKILTDISVNYITIEVIRWKTVVIAAFADILQRFWYAFCLYLSLIFQHFIHCIHSFDTTEL